LYHFVDFKEFKVYNIKFKTVYSNDNIFINMSDIFKLINVILSLIPTHQNSKPLLMSRYTTVTDILFYNYMFIIVSLLVLSM